MTHTHSQDENPQDRAAPARGADDRRRPVNPASNPAPANPDADHDAVRKGEENLDRVIAK